ncbi:hypothetical protein Mgra_00002324 [Meloidogyne graminicola]|uniref:Uncharacterized protein n=1 Tax=Meloidogyne graminicola TaxID=189291 RepID=A0A8S9ZYL3_9BILA|nr:hypothetical protein Mgra_00002324 [Meloidogyne graminicola]
MFKIYYFYLFSFFIFNKYYYIIGQWNEIIGNSDESWDGNDEIINSLFYGNELLNNKNQQKKNVDELNALNILKNAMEKRAEINKRLNEQLKFSSKQLDEVKETLKITRERIDGLESKCEMYGRLKKVLKNKLTELEYLINDSPNNNNIEQTSNRINKNVLNDEGEFKRLRIYRHGLFKNKNNIKSSEYLNKPNSSKINLCNNFNINGEQKIGIENEINKTQKHIQMLKGIEHRINEFFLIFQREMLKLGSLQNQVEPYN